MDQPTTFTNLQITGNVTFKRITKTPEKLTTAIAIVGPTGAGKSAFIEALCGDTSLGLSKNQLEGYTQEVTGYQLIGITHRGHSPILIIDTPGFADRKISEMEIMTKLKGYLEVTKVRVDYVLYLTPITDIRLTGSRKRVVEMFKAMTGVETSRQITIVTTMWNQLYTEIAIDQAQQRFKELSGSESWNIFISRNARIEKFLSTQDSAFHILDVAIQKDSPYTFQLGRQSRITGDSKYYQNLVSDLDERIQQLISQERNILDDLEQLKFDKNADPIVIAVLEEKLAEVGSDLERFGYERTQLDGIKKRWEIESRLNKLPSEINAYIFQLKEQCKRHDWDTNKPFTPLPPPANFISLFPRGLLQSAEENPSPPPLPRVDPDPHSLSLVSLLEERVKELGKDLEQLKEHLEKPRSHQTDSPQPPRARSPRRNWITSVRTWRGTKAKKERQT